MLLFCYRVQIRYCGGNLFDASKLHRILLFDAGINLGSFFNKLVLFPKFGMTTRYSFPQNTETIKLNFEKKHFNAV